MSRELDRLRRAGGKHSRTQRKIKRKRKRGGGGKEGKSLEDWRQGREPKLALRVHSNGNRQTWAVQLA